MVLLDISVNVEILIQLGELVAGVMGVAALYFRMQNKIDLMNNDFANFKNNTKDNLTKLETNMNSAYTKVENKIGELEDKMFQSHKELTDKIERLPETIATIFKTLK